MTAELTGSVKVTVDWHVKSIGPAPGLDNANMAVVWVAVGAAGLIVSVWAELPTLPKLVWPVEVSTTSCFTFARTSAAAFTDWGSCARAVTPRAQYNTSVAGMEYFIVISFGYEMTAGC
jgi:hypothetical protein